MKKGINFNINVNFTNRFLYTFVTLIFILIIGIGVFAITPGIAPNPGHLIGEFAPPVSCNINSVLQWDGTNWVCTNLSSEGSSLWSASGSNIFYNLGDVGIGTTFPQEKLDVIGNIKASGDICTDANGGKCLSNITAGAGGLADCPLAVWNRAIDLPESPSGTVTTRLCSECSSAYAGNSNKIPIYCVDGTWMYSCAAACGG